MAQYWIDWLVVCVRCAVNFESDPEVFLLNRAQGAKIGTNTRMIAHEEATQLIPKPTRRDHNWLMRSKESTFSP